VETHFKKIESKRRIRRTTIIHKGRRIFRRFFDKKTFQTNFSAIFIRKIRQGDSLQYKIAIRNKNNFRIRRNILRQNFPDIFYSSSG